MEEQDSKYVTFNGIVEDRNDPTNLGRVKVRIFGYSENKNDEAQWAMTLQPVNGSRSISVPKEGEWVHGFFLDGNNKQHPVISGLFPGIVPETNVITQTISAGNNFRVSPLINLAPPSSAPKPPAGVVGDVAGEPTVPRQARGVIDSTIIDKQNNDLAHVCDFISEMQKNMKLRQYMRTVAQAIRDAIRWVLKGLGFGDATGKSTWLINMLKAIKRELDWFKKKILKPIQDFEKYVLAYIVKMRAIIQWIMSLPARFMAILQDCLSRILKLIGAIFTDTIGGFSEGMELNSEGDFSELISAARDVATSAQDVLSTSLDIATTAAAIPVAATAGLFQPTTQGELDAANAYIQDYENSDANVVASPNEGKSAP